MLHEDLVTGRGGLRDVSKNIGGYGISPDGKRALFAGRGDIFTVPATSGPTRNLTSSPGAHDRDPAWSPDGKQIAYISDSSGEDEIWLIPQDGSDAAQQITTDGDNYKYQISWSPDGKKILWSDKKNRLLYVDVATKKVVTVTQAKWEIREFDWSPDSKWIAYAEPEREAMEKIYLYSLDANKSTEVTDGWYGSDSPCFSSDGKYLYFVSRRDFSPQYGMTEWNHIYLDMSRIYLVTLAKDTENPSKPKDDEVERTNFETGSGQWKHESRSRWDQREDTRAEGHPRSALP